MTVDRRRQRAQKALDDAGYNDPEAEAERELKKKKKKATSDEIEWVKAMDSVQTTGSN